MKADPIHTEAGFDDPPAPQSALERLKQFGGWKKKGEKAATSGTGKKTFECWNCGEPGHRAFYCKKPKVERQQAASSSSSTEEVAMLQAQLKEVKEQIAALMAASKKEGF